MRIELSRFDREYLEERSRSAIFVDDKTAVMGKRDFGELNEYSCTLPTGTYVGKRWKRAVYKEGIRAFDARDSDVVGWMMGEFAPSPDPKRIDIIWRDIVLLEDS